MHVCEQIAEAAKALLSNIPGLEDHIIFDEPSIAEDDKTPWAWVWTGDEIISQIDLGDMSGALLYQRDSDLVIELIVRGNAVSVLNMLLVHVERQMASDRYLAGTAKNCVLRDIQRARSNDPATLNARIRYIVTYITTNTDPETPV